MTVPSGTVPGKGDLAPEPRVDGDASPGNGKTSPTCVAELSEALNLPADFLAAEGFVDTPEGIGVTYRDDAGEDLFVRRGVFTLKADPPPDVPFGLNRSQDLSKTPVLHLVTRETDAAVLWRHRYRALALAGGTFQALQGEHLTGVDEVRVVQRDGMTLAAAARARLGEIGFKDQVAALTLPGGVRSVAGLHRQDPDRFRERFYGCRKETLKWERMENTPSKTVPPGGGAAPKPVPGPRSPQQWRAPHPQGRPDVSLKPEVAGAPAWPQPVPLGEAMAVPCFPTSVLPPWLAEWVEAEAEAMQVPADLPGMLALTICGAGLARRYRVGVRPGWTEPTNLFAAVALPPGDRKSPVFAAAVEPVNEEEADQKRQWAPVVAEQASVRRQLEGRLKAAENKISRGQGDLDALGAEARKLSRELAEHRVPPLPRFICDDATPEVLAKLLAEHDGRMLLASAEGTAFEICKGRYADGAGNFDVFLKGHVGDQLRVDRVGREANFVDRPALSVALAVQPDVICGLGEDASMRGKGFLARFLFSVPRSLVGNRKTAPPPVPDQVRAAYSRYVRLIWRLAGPPEGRPHYGIAVSAEADAVMRDFERRLEPRLAEGEPLAYLAGWANKLAGACARVAGILHVAELVATTQDLNEPVPARLMKNAISFGEHYLLPHAQAAFGLMALDKQAALAHVVWKLVGRQCAGKTDPVRLSRRDIHQACRTRQRFQKAEEIDPVIALLVDRYYLRPVEQSGQTGKGHKSPEYEVNPLALADARWE